MNHLLPFKYKRPQTYMDLSILQRKKKVLGNVWISFCTILWLWLTKLGGFHVQKTLFKRLSLLIRFCFPSKLQTLLSSISHTRGTGATLKSNKTSQWFFTFCPFFCLNSHKSYIESASVLNIKFSFRKTRYVWQHHRASHQPSLTGQQKVRGIEVYLFFPESR